MPWRPSSVNPNLPGESCEHMPADTDNLGRMCEILRPDVGIFRRRLEQVGRAADVHCGRRLINREGAQFEQRDAREGLYLRARLAGCARCFVNDVQRVRLREVDLLELGAVRKRVEEGSMLRRSNTTALTLERRIESTKRARRRQWRRRNCAQALRSEVPLVRLHELGEGGVFVVRVGKALAWTVGPEKME